MSDENRSAISHVSLGTSDFERSVRFYDAVLATLGCKRIMQHPGAAAWGKELLHKAALAAGARDEGRVLGYGAREDAL